MNTCPICGYQGTVENCPNDGARLLSDSELAEMAPPDPTQAPPPTPQRSHATVATPADDEALRDENYGKWAEPALPKKRRDPMIGRVIGGRYEVQSLLGKGGMGAVYKAWQPAVQRTIALKVLLSEFAENETVIKRFHQEALAASRLKHPNTISVYDFGQTDDGILYISMEYLRGQSLSQALSGGQILTPKRALHIMRQCCKSLSEAHKAGIIHRDLKPDNIFLTDIERDHVKVLDFGVAKLKEFEGKEGTLTQAGMIFGTPKYMSPEQARSGDLDPRSDVYALGIILYEMLMGQPPFVGDNPLSILIAHVNEKPKTFDQMRPGHDVPAALEAVVLKALNKNRDLRQQDVDRLQMELEAVNELLEGAPYESVAGRLPAVGGDGGRDHSVMGPAIVPAATDDTVHGGGGGDTMVLGGQADLAPPPPPGELVIDDTPPPTTRRGGAGLWMALGAVPVIGVGVWLAMGSSDADPAPDAAAATPVVDARVVATPTPPPDSGPRPDRSVAKAPPPPADDGKIRFTLESTPSGAKIFDAKGTFVGKTPDQIVVTAKATFTLKYDRHVDAKITLDPDDAERRKAVTMTRRKGKPRPPRPKSGEPTAANTGGKTVVVKPPPKAKPPKPVITKKPPKDDFDPDID